MSEQPPKEDNMATAEEWAVMNAVNKHFTFRERTAFLVGYRKGKPAGRAEERKRCAKIAWAEESDPPAESHEFIDGWMQGCHAVAAAIEEEGD